MFDYIVLVNKHILTDDFSLKPVMFHRLRYGHCGTMCTTSNATAMCQCDLQWAGSEIQLFLL